MVQAIFILQLLFTFFFEAPTQLTYLITIYTVFAIVSAYIVAFNLNDSFSSLFTQPEKENFDLLELWLNPMHSHLEARKTFLWLDQNVYAQTFWSWAFSAQRT